MEKSLTTKYPLNDSHQKKSLVEIPDAYKETESLSLSVDEDGVAWLAIDTANSKVNVLQAKLLAEIDEMLNTISSLHASKNNTRIQGLIICSNKKDQFIAGADIKMIAACQDCEEAEALAKSGQKMFERISTLPFTVIAAIDGPCLGGGLELALACDYRIASKEKTTQFGLPEVKIGLLPGSGGTQRLPRLIGLPNALDLILTGRSLPAKHALAYGIIDQLTSRQHLLSLAKTFLTRRKRTAFHCRQKYRPCHSSLVRKFILNRARQQAQKKAKGHYPAIDAIIDSINIGLAQGPTAGLLAEAKAFGKLAMTDAARALQFLFFNSTEMKKMSTTEKAFAIEKVGVMGSGLMGKGIAHVTVSRAKIPVRIKDIKADYLLSALDFHEKLLQHYLRRKRINQIEFQKQKDLLSTTTQWHGFQRIDIVQEAVFEDLTLKQELLQNVEKQAKEGVIFASNTSSVPIHKIAQASKHPENVIGVHYFSPVDKMPLVEIIPHAGTSSLTINKMSALVKKQGKIPVIVKDKAGFYVNRLLALYVNEAGRLFLEGESIEHIDRALIEFGFPIGPFALMDEVGLAVCAHIQPILVEELGEMFQGPKLLDILIEKGYTGKKAGRGFYCYEGKRKKVAQSLTKMFKVKPNPQLSAETIAMRCVIPLLNEAVKCLDEKIITKAEHGDIAAVMGMGFPPFLAGPFHYMQHKGLTNIVELMNQYTQRYGQRYAAADGLINRASQQQLFYQQSVEKPIREEHVEPA